MKNRGQRSVGTIFLAVSLWLMLPVAASARTPADAMLERNCLECHREQKLPDNLIYRRYLLKYSSRQRIEKALVEYLKHPSRKTSIMPVEFFLRFPMREPIKLDDTALHESVRKYIDYFDIRKRLQLEK